MPKISEPQIRAMYPELNEQGVWNYLKLVNRLGEPAFEILLAEHKEADECLLQPRIAAGTPEKSDCLVHGVEGDIGHHFTMNPDASTD